MSLQASHIAMDNATFGAIYKGHRFRKPKGERVFVAEKLTVHTPYYEAPYHYTYIMLRNEKTGKTESIDWDRFKREWVRVDPLPDEDKLHEAAIDSVLGVPWYRK